jgi:hypothetical protein
MASFLSFALLDEWDFYRSKYNTDTARILIYNAWWFEAIMVFFDYSSETLRGTNLEKKKGYFVAPFYLGSLISFQVRL